MPIINPCTDINKLTFPPGQNYGIINSVTSALIGAARGLIILKEMRLKLVDAKVSEKELLRVLSLPQNKLLGRWQEVDPSGPLEIMFDIDQAQFIYTNAKGFPTYDSGVYFIRGVFITAIFVQPHCCDGYFHVPYIDAIYSCITRQELEPDIPPFKECVNPVSICYTPPPRPTATIPPVNFPIC